MSINFISSEVKGKLKYLHKKQKLILKLSKIFAVLGVVFLVLSFAPSIWYSLATPVDDFSSAILLTANRSRGQKDSLPTVERHDWQPPFDSKLSRETSLRIPAIRVDTTIQEAPLERYEDALRKGVWRVPDFGTPADRKRPLILAAHRFGYLEWSNLYRRFNSFYNLPKLKVGDIVEITYKQRKYTYEIYAEGRGEEIMDYSANLILYTCETLNSKIRIFRYAKLLEI